MKAKVEYTDSTEADVFMSDGGVATMHHNGEHIITTYYQRRVVAEEMEQEGIEDIWEFLSEGKAYCKDWEGEDKVTMEMIKDAVHWLAPAFKTTIQEFNKPT